MSDWIDSSFQNLSKIKYPGVNSTLSPRAKPSSPRSKLSSPRSKFCSPHHLTPNKKSNLSIEYNKRPVKRLLIDDNANHSQSNEISINSFEPKCCKNLAVSKQKLNELRNWFIGCFGLSKKVNHFSNQTTSPFLLLNGPSGSGKTIAVKLLAQEYKIKIVELPITSMFNEHDMIVENLNNLSLSTSSNSKQDFEKTKPVYSESQLNRFKQFLYDQNHYKKDLFSNDTHVNKLLLVEEFPNLFFLKPNLLHEELFLLMKKFQVSVVPIVFIISDTVNGQSTELKILPKSIQAKLNIQTITFKPITNASLFKALSNSSIGQNLSKNDIDNIVNSCSGDIRNAFNYLMFLHSNYKSKYKFFSNGFSNKKMKLSLENAKKEKNVDFSGRNDPLSIVHAIAKVLYSKRTDSPDLEVLDFIHLHPTLNRSYLRNPLNESNPEQIAERSNMSCDMMVDWIYENFCDFVFDEGQLDYVTDCLDVLSETSSILTEYESKNIFESLRTSYLIRGTMFSLNRDASSYREVVNLFNTSQPKHSYTFRSLRPPKFFKNIREINDNISTVEELKNHVQFAYTQSYTNLVLDFLPGVSSMNLVQNQLKQLGLYKTVCNLVNFESKDNYLNCNQNYDNKGSSNIDDFNYMQTSKMPTVSYMTFTSGPGDIDSDTIEDDSD